ncbi:MAG: glutamate--tRNA ligase [Peptococcaceae bacterium]|jgi:glutamyl-tRNA synthetase|nr:glutamate--tRNA ligase [Peptococcaceae bacterium]
MDTDNRATRLSQGEREELAKLLFPRITKEPEDYEEIFPPRDLPEKAFVTRLGPSPTGFIHLGNLYGALADERLAHQSGGVFILRVEDTDQKREVPGAVELIISSLAYFGVEFDEGATEEGDKGGYGPYRQRARAEVYQSVACKLIRIGRAYPCFCTEEELKEIREKQMADKQNPGYYGIWAKHRDLTMEEIRGRLSTGAPFVIRMRSMGDPARSFRISDGIRGELTMPENDQDFVLLKADGIPTYHFAHVVDDHFMRITHILRGEEWLATLPYHHELFQALAYELPVFCHTTVLMKMDGGIKRKLSKRKDPELGLDYYRQLGYLPLAVKTYLLTVLNSNYEEWQSANPGADASAFHFTTEKMGSSGALFDLDKLQNVSKDVFAAMPAGEIYCFLLAWAETEAPDDYALLAEDADYITAIVNIGRGGANPRKDLIFGRQIMDFIRFFFDSRFVIEDTYPEQIPAGLAVDILEDYLAGYRFDDDNAAWFEKVRDLGVKHGFAAKPKDFKQHPEQYIGHVGDVSSLLRVALSGRRNSPDLWEIQQIMGEERSSRRIRAAIEGFIANA